MLYKLLNKPDKEQTQLAYKLRYFPGHMLGDAATKLISAMFVRTLRKELVCALLNEEQTHVFFQGKKYRVVWAFNNVPTEIEWTRKSPDYQLRLEFRTFLHHDKENICIFTLGSQANQS